MYLLSLLSAARAAEPASTVLPHELGLELGFAHWFSEAWGSPDGFTTPELTLAVQPGLSFLEVTLRYTRSVPELPLTNGTTVGVGFGSVGLLLRHTLRVGRRSITLYAGPEGFVHHDAAGGASIGGGGVIGVRYLFDVGTTLHIGPFLSAHELFYTLPGEDRDLVTDPRREAHIDLGVTVHAFGWRGK